MFKKILIGLFALSLLFGSGYAAFHQAPQQSATSTTYPTNPGDGGIGD